MVVLCLEDSAWKYAEVGKQIAAHDFCKWLKVLNVELRQAGHV